MEIVIKVELVQILHKFNFIGEKGRARAAGVGVYPPRVCDNSQTPPCRGTPRHARKQIPNLKS